MTSSSGSALKQVDQPPTHDFVVIDEKDCDHGEPSELVLAARPRRTANQRYPAGQATRHNKRSQQSVADRRSGSNSRCCAAPQADRADGGSPTLGVRRRPPPAGSRWRAWPGSAGRCRVPAPAARPGRGSGVASATAGGPDGANHAVAVRHGVRVVDVGVARLPRSQHAQGCTRSRASSTPQASMVALSGDSSSSDDHPARGVGAHRSLSRTIATGQCASAYQRRGGGADPVVLDGGCRPPRRTASLPTGMPPAAWRSGGPRRSRFRP